MNREGATAALSWTRCTFCGERVVLGSTTTTFDGDRARYRCGECGRWTRGPPPSR